MDRYRSACTTSLIGLGAVGAAVAVMASPASAVRVFVTAGLMAGVAGACVLVRTRPEPVPWRERLRSGSRCGVAGGLGLLALVGLDKVLPTWLLVGLVCLTVGPFALTALRMRHGDSGGEQVAARAGQGSQVGPAAVGVFDEDERRLHLAAAQAHAMSTLELCEAWPASFTELEQCTDPAARVWIVARRQIYLDELERRDPAALQAWLGSNARAASNPRRFLSRKEGDLR